MPMVEVWGPHGEHFRDQEDSPLISGALMQEETVGHAANTRSHTATRTRCRLWCEP